jgi:hypothetical protein
VVGEKIKAIFRNYGDRYNFTPDAPHEFIKEVNSFLPNNYSWSNLQEFITPVKTLI